MTYQTMNPRCLDDAMALLTLMVDASAHATATGSLHDRHAREITIVINGAIDECRSEQQIGELIAAVATFAAVTTNSLAQALGTSPETIVAALATTVARPH
jgi:hypothetical protein